MKPQAHKLAVFIKVGKSVAHRLKQVRKSVSLYGNQVRKSVV